MHQSAEKSTVTTILPTGNPRVRPVGVRVLADDWYVLRKATFDFRGRDGRWSRQEREAYDRGNGAVILLGDARAGTVLLTRQFRWPAYENGHPDGMLIEAPAGLLDGDDPAATTRRPRSGARPRRRPACASDTSPRSSRCTCRPAR
jgi:hypothetical protein